MKAPKYRNIKTVVDGITFDSAKEARRYGELKLLEKSGRISGLEVQPAFRIVVNNWVLSPGSACIQARGGDFTIQSNVCSDFNTGIGTGHPMAYNATDESKTVWTSAVVSNNLLADSRRGEPAQWGFSYMLGKPTTYTGNIVRGVPLPWMSSTDQGLRVPVGDVTRENNDVKTIASGIEWRPIIDALLSRKSGEWGEQFETGGVIERAK